MRLVLVSGDQLSVDFLALAKPGKAIDAVPMSELAAEASYVPYHPKKIAFTFKAIRKFAARLRAQGWRICPPYAAPDGHRQLRLANGY